MSGSPDRPPFITPPDALASPEAVTPPRMKVRMREPFTVPTPDFSHPWLDDTEGYGTEYTYAERVPGHYPFEIEGEGLVGRVQITQKSLPFSDRDPMHTPTGPVSARLIVDGSKSVLDMATLPFNVEVDVEDPNVRARKGAKYREIPRVEVTYKGKTYRGDARVGNAYIDDEKDGEAVLHNDFWRDKSIDEEEYRRLAFPVEPGIFDDIKITLLPPLEERDQLRQGIEAMGEALGLGADESQEFAEKAITNLENIPVHGGSIDQEAVERADAAVMRELRPEYERVKNDFYKNNPGLKDMR